MVRIRKLVAARAAVDRRLAQEIERAVADARAQGVPWPLIGWALGAVPWRARLRYWRVADRRTA